MNNEFIKDLAIKYADVCEFKSDFSHDSRSVIDGFTEGFEAAVRLIETAQVEKEVSRKATLSLSLHEFKKAVDEYVHEQETHEIKRTKERMTTIKCVTYWCKRFAEHLAKPNI